MPSRMQYAVATLLIALTVGFAVFGVRFILLGWLVNLVLGAPYCWMELQAEDLDAEGRWQTVTGNLAIGALPWAHAVILSAMLAYLPFYLRGRAKDAPEDDGSGA